MRFCYLEDNARLAAEREGLAQLQHRSTHVQSIEWKLIDGQLAFNVAIRANGRDYPLEFIYPNLYPHVPPIVRPQDKIALRSGHQYLNGTLCLEWGPDNWHPSVTGVQVLESAIRLLRAEIPTGNVYTESFPSRHRLTLGQELRTSKWRLYVCAQMLLHLDRLPHTALARIKFSLIKRSDSVLAVIDEIAAMRDGITTWKSELLPKSVRTESGEGLLIKADIASEALKSISDTLSLQRVLEAFGIKMKSVSGSRPGLFILTDAVQYLRAFYVDSVSGQSELQSVANLISPSDASERRAPAELDGLSSVSVGIVGLGSMGSKIALSLARSGVREFTLVDDDVFLPENICRHTLDFGHVGSHKVDGIENVLLRLGGGFRVRTYRANITEQESTSYMATIIDQLGNCDLLIDATASPRVFNILSKVSSYWSKPMVWSEVFAGGIGGLIARSRPGIDPDPQTMRGVLLGYLAERSESVPGGVVEEYTAQFNNEVLSASDSDVTAIASHTTRLILDMLGDTTCSQFPQSMYLIGLKGEWIFKAPFHTIPIETDHFVSDQVPAAMSEEALSDLTAFLQTVIG